MEEGAAFHSASGKWYSVVEAIQHMDDCVEVKVMEKTA